MKADEDFEVYENTRRVLGRLPGDRFALWLFEALPDFIRRRGTDDIEDFLAAIAAGDLGPEALRSFNDAWAKAETAWSDQLLELVQRLEHHGSLRFPGRVGELRPFREREIVKIASGAPLVIVSQHCAGGRHRAVMALDFRSAQVTIQGHRGQQPR